MHHNGNLPNRAMPPDAGPTRFGWGSTPTFSTLPDEQRNRAHQPRDQEESEGRRDLSGRQLTPQAGDGEAEVHSGARMGQEEVPGNVQAGKDGQAEGKGGGQEEKGTEDG